MRLLFCILLYSFFISSRFRLLSLDLSLHLRKNDTRRTRKKKKRKQRKSMAMTHFRRKTYFLYESIKSHFILFLHFVSFCRLGRCYFRSQNFNYLTNFNVNISIFFFYHFRFSETTYKTIILSYNIESIKKN